MTRFVVIPLLTIAGVFLLDSVIRPRRTAPFRPWRNAAGSWIIFLTSLVAYGTFLGLSGNPVVAALLVLGLQLALVAGSNAKRRMLGEPLLFSDLALVGAIFRHPQFYLTALRGWQKASAVFALMVLAAVFAFLFVPEPGPHLMGAGICAVSFAVLTLSLRLTPFRVLAARPSVEADVARLGLVPSLLVYWLRWRASADPAPSSNFSSSVLEADPSRLQSERGKPELVVAVQCESFADPAELFGDPAFALPGLESARAEAGQWGNLLVSGFGAYTMRTEYGVLFGREEEELGFRRFDPFLTAEGEASYALPHRLGIERWRSMFVHPHDMRFYGRDRVLPAGGFADLVGERNFEPPAPEDGRYVSDAAIARKILMLAETASSPTFIYAVTIENHGPWSSREGADPDHLKRNYNRLVGAGDAMLAQLRAGIAALDKPALLVFFGDHRPSIPGISEPGGARHTPYVMLHFDSAGGVIKGGNQRKDITPAQLHHAILDAVQ